MVEEFETNGPFSDGVPITEALSYISSTREQLGALKTEEDSLRRGLGIFKIDQPPSHTLMSIDKVRMSKVIVVELPVGIKEDDNFLSSECNTS